MREGNGRWVVIAAGMVVVAGTAWFLFGRDAELTRSPTCDAVEPGGTRLRSLPPPGAAQQSRDPAARLGANADPAFRPGGAESVYCEDLADPFVLRVDQAVGSRLFVYGTNTDEANVPVLISRSVLRSERVDDALPTLPGWAAPGGTWAPSVLQHDDRFILFYSVTERSSGLQCISVATTEEAEGPFEDSSPGPLICPHDLGGAIDPSPFVAADGRAFLLWKNDGNCCGVPVAIHVQPLADDGLTLAGEPVELIRATQPWEASIVEAPAMVEHKGVHYLFYSANAWNRAAYGIGYATCDTPTGPCRKPLEQAWLGSSDAAAGPGGQEFFVDGDGGLRMAFHAWSAGKVGYQAGGFRSLYTVGVDFVDGAPVTAAQGSEEASRSTGVFPDATSS